MEAAADTVRPCRSAAWRSHTTVLEMTQRWCCGGRARDRVLALQAATSAQQATTLHAGLSRVFSMLRTTGVLLLMAFRVNEESTTAFVQVCRGKGGCHG